jgi:hypothetical protein
MTTAFALSCAALLLLLGAFSILAVSHHRLTRKINRLYRAYRKAGIIE